LQPLKNPVSLATIKTDPALKDLKLLRQSRLSVTPLTIAEFDRLLKLGQLVFPPKGGKIWPAD